MAEALSEDEILHVLPFATGYSREVLIRTLAFTTGEAGVGALRQLVVDGRGNERAAALSALARRTGSESTQPCIDALNSTSFNLQEIAAMLLAEFGDASATPAMLEWLQRKLRRRSTTWSPYTLPAAIRFGVRHDVLGEVAATVRQHSSRLHDDERRWLIRTWPSEFGRGTPRESADPISPPALIQRDIYEDERRSSGPGSTFTPDEKYWDHARVALTRAARRAERLREA
jgi:hypothetical protein